MNIKLIATFVVFLMAMPVFAEENSGPTQQLEGFNLNGYTNTGKKSWEINGDKADISDEKIKVTNVNANFYNPKQNANLTSKTGTIDKVNGDVHLQDDVVVTADRGTVMTTDSLDWKRNQDLVTTNDLVRIEDEQGTVTGKGLTGHPNLKNAKLNEDVKAVLKTSKDMAKSQTVEITCDGPMEMDQTKMMAIFNKNVIAREPATGRELRADIMKVWFDDKNKRIKKLICTGHVSVIQGENQSFSDEMIYYGEDQRLIMTGRPRIIFDAGEGMGKGVFQKVGQ